MKIFKVTFCKDGVNSSKKIKAATAREAALRFRVKAKQGIKFTGSVLL